MPASASVMKDRTLAALVGGALGDAMGMPAQLLSPEQTSACFGHVETFVAPSDGHPVSRGLEAGTVTDESDLQVRVPGFSVVGKIACAAR